MKIKRIIDISGTINSSTTVWPGDEGVTVDRIKNMKNGDSYNLSLVHMGVHTSTHVDAPLHFIEEGLDISSVNLEKFIGCAKVFEFYTQDCIKASNLCKLDINSGDIVLFKTSNSSLDVSGDFNEEFVSLDESAAKFLVDKKIATVGIDYLSVERFDSNISTVHNLLLQNEIGIIEGLRLRDVPEGEYFLSCVPLKIEGAEGSPARAVLIEFYL